VEKYLALGFVLVCVWHFKSQIKALLVKMGFMKAASSPSAPAANASSAPVVNENKE